MNLNPLTADDSTDAAGDAGDGATGGSNWRRRAGIAAAALAAVGLVRRRRSSGGDDVQPGVNEGSIEVNPEAEQSGSDGSVDDVAVPDAEGGRATTDDEGSGIGRRLLATTAGVAVLAVVGRLVKRRN